MNSCQPWLLVQVLNRLLDAYKAFTRYPDKLTLFAAGPSDVGVTFIGGFHKTSAIQVVSELGVPDVLGDQELPLSPVVLLKQV